MPRQKTEVAGGSHYTTTCGKRWRGAREVSDGRRHVVYSERGGGLTPSSIVNWFTAAYRHLGWRGARPILAAGHSSPALPASFIKPAGRYATFSCSPVTDPFRQPRPTSTATPTFNAG